MSLGLVLGQYADGNADKADDGVRSRLRHLSPKVREPPLDCAAHAASLSHQARYSVVGSGALPLRPGERYRLEVMLPDSEAKFVRVGEVRYVGEAGVGFKIVEPLPDAAASVLRLLKGTIATP